MRSIRMRSEYPLVIAFLVLLGILAIPMDARGDIAPYDRIGITNKGVFIEEENVTMESFFVNVTVDLPDVHESFVYYLRNVCNRTVRIEAIIPIFFEEDRFKTFEPEYVEVLINDRTTLNFTSRTRTWDDVWSDDNTFVMDMDHYTGIAVNLTFGPHETLKVECIIDSYHTWYTESFHYFYTARTARFWNGTIERGYFCLDYISELRSIRFDIPNGTWDGLTLESDMYDWDGDADYDVLVDTGVQKGPNSILIPCCFLTGISSIVIIFSIIMYFSSKKAHKEGKKGVYFFKHPIC